MGRRKNTAFGRAHAREMVTGESNGPAEYFVNYTDTKHSKFETTGSRGSMLFYTVKSRFFCPEKRKYPPDTKLYGILPDAFCVCIETFIAGSTDIQKYICCHLGCRGTYLKNY